MNRRMLGLGAVGAALVAAAAGAFVWLAKPQPEEGAGNFGYDFSRLEEALATMVVENRLPGAAMIVVRGDERIFEYTVGEFTLDTWVTVGSATKWASAAAIMSLVDDGTLALDEPIAKHVESFRYPPKDTITLDMALAHRAGMLPKHGCLREYDKPLMSCVDQIAATPLQAAPDTTFGYGALSYHVAAGMAEQATGKSWRDIFQERIAQPLEMPNTRYGRGGGSPNPGIAGNLVSSANDFSHFLQMILNRGTFRGKRVLSEESIELMEAAHGGKGERMNHIPDRHVDSDYAVYGYGAWRDVITPKGGMLVMSAPGKFGFTPWIDRRRNVAAVLVAEWSTLQLNYGKPPDPADVIYLVCDTVHRADFGPQPSPNPACKRKGVSRKWK